MTETKQDFTMREGDTVRIEDTVENDDGTARDLTNHTIQFVLSRYNGAEPAIEYTDTDTAVQITDAANGKLAVDLDNADTDGLADTDVSDYYYEIELTDSSGSSHTVTVGTITIEPSY